MSYTGYDFPHTHFYDSDLRELLHRVKSLQEAYNVLDAWVKETDPKIDEIMELFTMIKNGEIPEAFKDAIYQWATTNLLPIVARTLKTVVFGLTDDGHFVATYYDSWRDIQFNTTEYDIWTPLQPQFGHLTLSV